MIDLFRIIPKFSVILNIKQKPPRPEVKSTKSLASGG